MNSRTQNVNNILDGLHMDEDVASMSRRSSMNKTYKKLSNGPSPKVKNTAHKSDFSLAKKDYEITYDEQTKKGDEWDTTTKTKVIKAHSSKGAEEIARKEMEKARTPEKSLVFRSVHLKD